MQKRTAFEKIWQAHLVQAESPEHPALLYIDRHLIHEVTSPQAFAELARRGLTVRRPDKTFATLDHSVPSDREKRLAYPDSLAREQVATLRRHCRAFGIPLFDLGSQEQGIVHVMGPELGLTLPGQTLVCGDSHTATHGAFGALAFGIGTSEVAHVLATQCLWQRRPKTMSIDVEGQLPPGVSAKDLILAIIRRLGAAGGRGYVIEYRGSGIRALSMDERMTVCNMSIEAGARAGLVAPDATTFAYLEGRPYAPRGAAWEASLDRWQGIRSDEGASFDAALRIDARELRPMVTFGTSPDQAVAIDEDLPLPALRPEFSSGLAYMRLEPGQPLLGTALDVVFIGSCTNGRLSDLRVAAEILRGRKKAKHLRLLIVPGSESVKRQAEAEGLAEIFLQAGAEWREPSCSMCIAMNGDQIAPGQLALSTSNRNFAGRQGKLGRTILGSPATAAASAISGYVADPRNFLAGATHDGSLAEPRIALSSAPRERYRYRSDHTRALSEADS